MMRTMSPLIDGLYRQGEKIADTKAPHDVPIARRWEQRKFNAQLVNPANRRKLDIIVVGSGLAGGAAAASLGEQGYNVKCFFYQDSARRAHSIAAQSGINAAKNYRNDGDSVYRLFYDTVKGGDYRAREDNVPTFIPMPIDIPTFLLKATISLFLSTKSSARLSISSILFVKIS